MVKKTDGTIPSVGAISMAARDSKKQKHKRGRQQGHKATTRDEDKLILKAFKKMRPPGCKGREGEWRRERKIRKINRERKRDRERERERERGRERKRERERERERKTKTERQGEIERERERERQRERERE